MIIEMDRLQTFKNTASGSQDVLALWKQHNMSLTYLNFWGEFLEVSCFNCQPRTDM